MIWTSASLTFRRKIARLNHWAKIKRDSWRVLLRRYQDSLTVSFDSSASWDLQNFSSSQPAWVLAKNALKRLFFVLKFILFVCQYFRRYFCVKNEGRIVNITEKLSDMLGTLNCLPLRTISASEPGARFSKVPVINGPGKLSRFPLKIEVSIVLHLTW